jgi:hypothetical protein
MHDPRFSLQNPGAHKIEPNCCTTRAQTRHSNPLAYMVSGLQGLTVLSVGPRRSLPTDDRQACYRIEHLKWAGVEAMTGKHVLRGPRRHIGKDRSSTGQSHIRHPRQVEKIVVVQEHLKHIRAANNANAAARRAEHRQGVSERSTGRIPEQRVGIRRVGRDGRNLPGQDQSAAQLGTLLPLVRVAPVHHHIDPVSMAA